MKISINGVIIKRLKPYEDTRGTLIECFRQDELPNSLYPVMSYISLTHSNIARGPHEHLRQTDYFCFPGPAQFELYLWDNRRKSKTYGKKVRVKVGGKTPTVAIVPSGVVHAYKNISKHDGIVLNYPNKLYAGRSKRHKVDEIRYENNPEVKFAIQAR